jgi:hypothetical protein
MKIDIDSYLYIIITIVILIITALGRRKKKSPQQATGKTAGRPAGVQSKPEQYESYEDSGVEQVTSDPFERLEQLFAPQETVVKVQEEEPETVQSKMELDAEARRLEEMEREREQRYSEKIKEEQAEAFRIHTEGDLTAGPVQGKEEEISLLTLFDDPEDFTKAIIYSEIFNTKYF